MPSCRPRSGSLDARLREAEVEMRDLERLIPVRTERETSRAAACRRRRAGSPAAHDAVKDARHRWKVALKSVGLPEDFAPPKVKQVVKGNEQVLELRRRRDARKDELDQRERELLVVNNRLQQILDDVRHSCVSDQPIVRIRELIQAVAKEKETLALREDVDKRLRKLVRSRDKAIAVLRKCSRSRHALLTLAGVEDEKGFRQAAADASPRGRSEAAARRADDSDSDDVGQHIQRRSRRHGVQGEGRDIKSRWDQRQKQLADIRARLAQVHERRGACTHEMQSLARTGKWHMRRWNWALSRRS